MSALFKKLVRQLPIAPDQQRDIALTCRMSLNIMLAGHGKVLHWSTLSNALNMSVIFCEYGIEADALELIKQAQSAAVVIRQRHERTGKWAFGYGEAPAIMSACDVHEQQLAKASRAQIDACCDAIRKRVEAGEIV